MSVDLNIHVFEGITEDERYNGTVAKEWSGENGEGYEINLDDIPDNIKSIRFVRGNGKGDRMGRKDIEQQILAIEYSDLIGKVFGNGEGVGLEVTRWEMRNFERTFNALDTADFWKGIVLLLDLRKQQILVQMGR